MYHVIIDCDPGIDDTLALMYAIQSPQIHIDAITITCGNVPAELGFKNVMMLLERYQQTAIPVYVGATQPLKTPFISAQDTHGEDGLGEAGFQPQQEYQAPSKTAAEFLAEFYAKPQTTELIALGPLTNIALALAKNPAMAQHVPRFVSMGGCYKSFGNCSPVAEYNYWCDPDAAAAVFQQMPQIEMVGLDVTREIVLTPTILEYMKQTSPEIGTFIEKITRFYFDFHWQQERVLGCVINDPLAVVYALYPEVCTGFSSYTEICPEGVARGQSIVDAQNFWQKTPNSTILTQVNRDAFFIEFLGTLLNVTPEIIKQDLFA